jgi:capsular polysaccharide biosynthesis protein
MALYFLDYRETISLPLKLISLPAYKAKFPNKVIPIFPHEGDPHEDISVFNNGYVFEDGWIITENSELLDTGFVNNKQVKVAKDIQTGRKNFSQIQKFHGTLAVIAINEQESYTKWLFKVLPRIELIKKSKIPYDKIYIYNMKLPYQRETLKLLGFDNNNIYFGRENVLVQSEKLIVPSILDDHTTKAPFPKWIIKFLNKEFGNKKEEIESPKKVFISRSKASSRRIVNESEVFKVLENKGYEKVFLEDLKVIEQAQLFYNANEIIGVYGSGLANLVFCKKGAKVIEINPSIGVDKGFFNLITKQKELVFKEIITDSHYLTSEQIKNEDVYVELPKLIKILNTKY